MRSRLCNICCLDALASNKGRVHNSCPASSNTVYTDVDVAQPSSVDMSRMATQTLPPPPHCSHVLPPIHTVHTCMDAGQPSSFDMGRMATLRQMRSMLHSSSVRAVGSTTVRKGLDTAGLLLLPALLLLAWHGLRVKGCVGAGGRGVGQGCR